MSYSINSNIYLRQSYGIFRDLTSSSKREHTEDNSLSYADSTALGHAIKVISRHEYSSKLDPTETSGPVKEYGKKLHAFIDTYNLTLDSSSKSHDSAIKIIAKKMKSLSNKYKDKLSAVGISLDKQGFMKLSESMKIKSTKEFEEVFGNNSDFMKELKKVPGLIQNHIDTTA